MKVNKRRWSRVCVEECTSHAFPHPEGEGWCEQQMIDDQCREERREEERKGRGEERRGREEHHSMKKQSINKRSRRLGLLLYGALGVNRFVSNFS